MLNNVLYFQPPSISHQQKNIEKGHVRDTSIYVSQSYQPCDLREEEF